MNLFEHGWRNCAVLNLGGGSGSSSVQPVGQQVVQQKSDPWDEQKPYLQAGMAWAQNLAGTPKQYYPGSTVVPLSGQSQDALAAIESRARAGSPLLDAGRSTMLDTANGKYLDPSTNPWLKATYDAAAKPMVDQYRTATSPGIDAGATRAGRYGSAAWGNQQQIADEALGRSLGDLSTSIYGGNYNTERNRQMDAVSASPQFSQADYQDATALANVGAQREAQAGRELSDQVNRWNFAQDEPWARIGDYMSLVNGNYGRTQTTSQPIYAQQSNNNWLGTLGGLGLMGASFLSSKKLKDQHGSKSVSEKVADLNVPTWNYKGDDTMHMGPMAEDFRDTFGIGDGVTLNPVDMFGVMMKSNKELAQRVKHLEGKKHGPSHWGA